MRTLSLQPVESTIKEQLVELKDRSELMVKLAYLALLLNSEDLAKEILELEEEFDDLHTKYGLEIIRMKCAEPQETGLLGLVTIGFAAENIADAARDMAEIVLRRLPPHPVLRSAIELTVEQATIAGDCDLVGKTVGEAEFKHKIGMTIIAIKRGKTWTYNPSDSFMLEAGDLVFAEGYPESKGVLAAICSGKPK